MVMNRRGASLLVVALLLLVLAGAVGLFFSSSWRSAREGTTTLWSTRVRLAADAESQRALADWDAQLAETIPSGSGAALRGTAPGQGVTTRDSLFRLGEALYFLHVVAEERSFAGVLLARAGVARIVPLLSPTIPDSQGILALSPVSIAATAAVRGEDQLPGGWESNCPPPALPAAGLRAAPIVPVAVGCLDATCISGSPAIARDTSLLPEALDRLGAITIQELLARADQRVSGVLSVGPVGSGLSCNREVPTNWGDPLGALPACFRYFPIVVAAGGTRVDGGTGQGILIGLGPLVLAGDLEFRGVILARGPLLMRDRARVAGTVLAADSVSLQDGALVARSVCAISRAERGSGRPTRRVAHGWIRWP
jgi:hypothetical protein